MDKPYSELFDVDSEFFQSASVPLLSADYLEALSKVERIDWDKGYYVGHVLDGKPHGRGRYYLGRVLSYKGAWYHGRRQGYGIMCDRRGRQLHIGEWKHDKPDGQGERYDYRRQMIYVGWFNGDRFRGDKIKLQRQTTIIERMMGVI